MKEFFTKAFWQSKEGKEELHKTVKFTGSFLVLFFVFNFLLGLIPIQIFEEPIARLTASYLTFLGISNAVIVQEPVLILLSNDVQIVISYLCTGLLELTVLIAAILASHGIPWRKRIIGAAASIIIAQMFNLGRIFITLHFILESDVEVIDFVHGTLFRMTLLIVIAGLYAVWFAWAVGKLKMPSMNSESLINNKKPN